ncbi:sulfite exporter TauE/SafE family protein [Allorhizobium sp. BGMRC 0089]|uniref:sulfite exporter TauE/SafE family protein n=1 Tax=Allorhizobium sonneratiae TaxID=2934936 RepID=UPI0020349B77|nr:sulfite exporter TauE/SafE family protein [Allorhizobium sonneratiae]MCM2292089.1 sulfite exporter TauE/SafE family protein [Allorhizobium sonneratiae]
MSTALFAALGSGGLVGFTLGLLGGGGSILATPLLLYVVGVASPHVAIGTGALAVAVNAALNFVNHAMKGNVRWRCGLVFSAFGVVGAFAGSSLGKAINGSQLLLAFGILMVVVGALMLKPRKVAAQGTRSDTLTMCALTALTAIATGAASGFFGIGGGFLIVPGLMLATGMPMVNAVGTSLMAVTTFGLATAVNYSLSGMVDWPVAGEFIAGGLAGGLIGTLLATKLGQSKNTLNRIFAGVIFVVAVYIIYKSVGQIVTG